MFQRDYVLRMVQQAAQAIARAMGLVEQQRLDDADGELSGAYALLGLDRELVLLLDRDSLARVLDGDDKRAAAIRLLLSDAELAWQRGDRELAHKRVRAAGRLHRDLQAAHTDVADALAAWLPRLA
jgi:hypothetical protein